MCFLLISWDEWATESRVLKYNDANVTKQAELLEQHSAIAAKNKKGTRIVIFSVFIYFNKKKV